MQNSLTLVYSTIGYINLALSCLIILAILYWIVAVCQYTRVSRRAYKLVASQHSDVYQKRELTNKKTDYHKGILLLLILTLELTQKLTAIITYAVINLQKTNDTHNDTCSSSLLELYSVMRHSPTVLVLRAVSNAAVLGMLSSIALTLIYLTNAYGQRGNRKNFRNTCIYLLTHCLLVLVLSSIAHTWLLGYVSYEVLSVGDFILIVRSARELYRVLGARITEAEPEFVNYHSFIQRKYKLVISCIILCLFVFVLGVFVNRISTILKVLLDYPCFFQQTYNLPIYLYLQTEELLALRIVSHSLLVTFYVCILIFDILFVLLNLAAIVLRVCPQVIFPFRHSDKKNRALIEPLIKRYHKSIK